MVQLITTSVTGFWGVLDAAGESLGTVELQGEVYVAYVDAPPCPEDGQHECDLDCGRPRWRGRASSLQAAARYF